jgi:hypothetical protein
MPRNGILARSLRRWELPNFASVNAGAAWRLTTSIAHSPNGFVAAAHNGQIGIYSVRSIPICIASRLELDHSHPQGRHRPGGCQIIRQT